MRDATHEIRSNRTGIAWEIALIFVVFFVAGGAPVPHVNETHYLAKAKHYWNPDWCADDLFLESGEAHLTFYWTVGALTQWFDLPTVAWTGRCGVWLLLAIFWQRLSRCVASFRYSSVLSAMLFVTLIDWTNFAGEWVIGGVEGKCIAYAFVFWGLAAMATQRWNWAGPCFGLAAAFHVLVGGWSMLVAGFVWFTLPRGERPALPLMLPWLMLGVALSLLGFLPALQLATNASPEAIDEANQVYVFDRLAHHLAPLTLKPTELGLKSFRFGLLLLGFVWLRSRCSREAQLNSGLPFRSLDLLMRFALGTLVISVLGLVWELATWNDPAISARLLKYYLFRMADVALPLATCLAIVWFTQLSMKQNIRLAGVILLFATWLPASYLAALSWQRYQNRTPPAMKATQDPAAWLDACRWVRAETAADSLFLVPREAQSFKWYAHRRDLVTRKDVPQSANALLNWRDRYYDVHRYQDVEGNWAFYRSLAVQETPRIRQLAEKYQLDYILTVDYPPLDLPVAYKNARYIVYDARD